MCNRQLVLNMNDDFGAMSAEELSTLLHDLSKYFRYMSRTIGDSNIIKTTDEISDQLIGLECYVGQFVKN